MYDARGTARDKTLKVHAIAGDQIFDYIDDMDPSTICMNFGACPPVMRTRLPVSTWLSMSHIL